MNTDLAKNTILLTIGTIISKGLLFVMLPFFSSWLTTEEYGTYDVITTYVSLLVPFLTLATGEGVFRYSVEANAKERKKYITNGLLILFMNYGVFAVMFTAFHQIFPIHHWVEFLMLLFGHLLDTYVSSYLRATKQLKIYSFSNAVTVILITIAVTLLVYFFKWGVTGILTGYAFGYIIGSFLILLISKLHENLSVKTIQKGTMARLIRYSSPLVLNNVSWWFMNVSDRSIISFYLGNAANGIYAIACKVPTLCTAIFSMFNVSWQQTASEMIGNSQIESYLNKVYRQMNRILLSICCGILACNFIFFKVFFDIKYYDAHFYVSILVTSAILLSLSQFFGGVQIALKAPKYVGYTTVAGAIVNVVLNALTVKYFGLWAASITTLLGNAAILILRKVHISKQYHIRIGRKEYLCIIIYIYFAASSYYIENNVLNVMNLVFSIVFFVLINQNYFMKFITALERKRKA